MDSDAENFSIESKKSLLKITFLKITICFSVSSKIVFSFTLHSDAEHLKRESNFAFKVINFFMLRFLT